MKINLFNICFTLSLALIGYFAAGNDGCMAILCLASVVCGVELVFGAAPKPLPLRRR